MPKETRGAESLLRQPARPRRPGDGLRALQAILGLPLWPSVGLAAAGGWEEEALIVWHRFARRVLRPGSLLAVLDQVASGSPAVASQWLNEWLSGRKIRGDLNFSCREWVDALPGGLELEGSLQLPRRGLNRLPRRLKVGSDLWLERSGIFALPDGLDVGCSLWLRGCRDWDGEIPGDARVASRVVTDRHPHGIPLAEWRARYPLGERPDLRSLDRNS